ncbi:alkaline phosphatase 3 precursor [Oceanobacillus picturae]|uniref:Alkaline phosphatase 3 n=1 Tax=Oceanobacillus picturae TaxID=171693 RepID=A0A0U9H6G4_9BACI|nr:alkaline phosphatase [Oceanobacillus picturae]GAQ17648.1 alkaline phosphatase 3 precursor [Oceanobacillus picturae]
MFKKVGVVALSAGLIFSGMGSVPTVEAGKPEWAGKGKPDWVEAQNGKQDVENVIYMIPDGFNADYAKNYRLYKGEDAAWDKHLKGMYTTYSANSSITDSAAAGTAMATGVKTNNGMIGLNPEGEELETILEASQEQEMATGLVSTSAITHATPAAFASHVESRNNETEIARQLIANEVDVMLGGGMNNFLPETMGGNQEDTNVLEAAKERGYKVIETRQELMNQNDIALKQDDKLLGLFAGGALPDELARDKKVQPSLAEMTETAVEILEQDEDGFFLMVEGSQIDWAGHANDAGWAMSEVEAFEAAVKAALAFAEEDGETLVVIGGDHETGGMTTGIDGSPSNASPEILKKVKATGTHMASELNEGRTNSQEVLETYTDLKWSASEIQQIQEAKDPAAKINELTSNKANIGWTSSNHTSVDIPLYVYGPGSEDFTGFHDNTDLPKFIAESLGISLDN